MTFRLLSVCGGVFTCNEPALCLYFLFFSCVLFRSCLGGVNLWQHLCTNSSITQHVWAEQYRNKASPFTSLLLQVQQFCLRDKTQGKANTQTSAFGLSHRAGSSENCHSFRKWPFIFQLDSIFLAIFAHFLYLSLSLSLWELIHTLLLKLLNCNCFHLWLL